MNTDSPLDEILDDMRNSLGLSSAVPYNIRKDAKDAVGNNVQNRAKQAIELYCHKQVIEAYKELLNAEIIKPEYHNLIVGKIGELKNG